MPTRPGPQEERNPYASWRQVWFSHFYFKSLGNKSPGRSGWLSECLSKVLLSWQGSQHNRETKMPRQAGSAVLFLMIKQKGQKLPDPHGLSYVATRRTLGPRSLGGRGCHSGPPSVGSQCFPHAGVYHHAASGASPGRRWALEGSAVGQGDSWDVIWGGGRVGGGRNQAGCISADLRVPSGWVTPQSSTGAVSGSGTWYPRPVHRLVKGLLEAGVGAAL